MLPPASGTAAMLAAATCSMPLNPKQRCMHHTCMPMQQPASSQTTPYMLLPSSASSDSSEESSHELDSCKFPASAAAPRLSCKQSCRSCDHTSGGEACRHSSNAQHSKRTTVLAECGVGHQPRLLHPLRHTYAVSSRS